MKSISFSIIGEIRAAINMIDERPLLMLSNILSLADRVFLAGSGRGSDTARIFARRLAALGKETHVSGEAASAAVRRGDVVILFASSEDTRGMALIAKKAYEAEGTIVVFSPTSATPLADYASIVIPIPRPAPDLIASSETNSALFDQVTAILADAISSHVAKKMNLPQNALKKSTSIFE